ncbi:N-acetylmuramoyl-L-alanine amidase [Candidatus Ruminimicrobiellum ovillum]|uniref:N-acetylmuramoyl-L-alanine amidase n=1 Tax=Candidatus Ruminimicrobiellum ovillum TaxID=1947927 RepID=UPI003559C32F
MKKFVGLLSLFFVFVSVYCFAKNEIKTADITVEAQKLNVIFDGQGYDGMNLYSISGSNFLSLRELASFCQARLEWYSVSKKVSMKFKNRSIDIFYDSRKVSFGKNKVKLKMPSVMINKEVYVPVEILELKYFPEMLEAVVNLDTQHRILNVTSISNISAVRYYTKENNTEIVIELEEQMTHTIKKAKNSIVVAFQRGKIIKDSVVANNGAIKDISYETKGREAVFTINLAQTPKSVRVQNFKKPFKLVMDIEHTKPVDMAKPTNIYIPDTVARIDKKTISAVEEKIIDEKKEQKSKDVKSEEKVQIEKKSENVSEIQTEQKVIEQQQEKPEDIGSDTEVVSIDTRIIANDSQIYDKPVLEEEEDDSEALAKVKVVTVEEDQIIDDSYAIIDDTETFKDIIPKTKEIAKDAKIIVLDAGHGGKDPGAVGPHGTKEKDVNLAIVLQLEKIFKKDKNYKVILTRQDDTFIPLVERANIANKNKADLFISVHCNANLNRTASGFEIYFLSEKASDKEAISTETLENSVIALEDKSDEKKTVLQNMLWSMVVNEYINESSELSSFVIAEASGRLKIPSRGIKQANFYVLRGTQMPSVLVETAYISNYTEEAKLNTSSFQKAAADSIYEGVKKYYARKANKK